MNLFANPLEQFEIVDFLYFGGPLMGMKFSLTNIGLYLILVATLALGVNLLASNHHKIVDSSWSLGNSTLYNSILNLSVSNGLTGPLAGLYVPFIYTVFIFILISNLVGLVPYSFTVTSQFALTIGLSMTIFIGVTILGLTEHGIRFFSLFIPSGAPLFLVPLLVVIETVSYLARSLSLGIRLAGNMFAGHVLLKIISGFIWKIAIGSALGVLLVVLPMAILFALLGLELAVAGIQAYVFSLLTCSYIRDAVYLH